MLTRRCQISSLSRPFANFPLPSSSCCRRKYFSTRTNEPDSRKQPHSQTEEKSDSIFSPTESAWDHVFKDIREMPPLLPSSVRNPLRTDEPPPGGPNPRFRRQTMTAREISAFDEMFDMIFHAVNKQKTRTERDTSDDLSIGRSLRSQPLTSLFSKLRRHSKKVRWTTESDEELDRKKEEIDLCGSDQELLDWAQRKVFDESKKCEEEARKSVSEASVSGKEQESFPELQPPTYPFIIAHLMRTFRDKYSDPHLALSIFNHARHLSIASYVFGCTTPAYNELIETRWACFRDLKGVHDALEEMLVNGVETDSRTRKLVEALRREVGERNVWEEETDLGNGEIWSLMMRIESLVVKPAARETRVHSSTSKRRSTREHEGWKKVALDKSDDGWEFDRWRVGDRSERSHRDGWRQS